MKKYLSIIIALLISISSLSFVFPCVLAEGEMQQSTGTTYYVDAYNGNDGNVGTTESQAWKSIEKVNSTTFKPGDTILLKKDSVWVNTFLWPKGSGEEGNPITISCYGDGETLPTIKSLYDDELDGLPNADACVYLENQSYVVIENLYIINGTPGAGDQSGVRILMNSSYRTYGNVVRDCIIFGSSDKNWTKVSRSGLTGINVSAQSYNGYIGSVTIENNEIYNCKALGIVVNGTVSGCNKDGVIYAKAATNVVVRGNYLSNIGADGILVNNCNAPLVEYNVVNNSHSYALNSAHVAIWSFACYNALFQYNEAYNTKSVNDGEGYDCDYQCYGTTFQYNYSHDNDGGFMLICVEPKNWDGGVSYNVGSIVRYNISQNDKYRIFSLVGHILDTKIYNNSIYCSWATSSVCAVYEFSKNSVYSIHTQFINNLWYVDSGSFYLSNSTQVVWQNNLVYGKNTSSAPKNDDPNAATDADGITSSGNIYYSDPMFVDVGGAGIGIDTCDAYILYDNSPAIGAGQVIYDNINTDFFGNPVSDTQAPNIGAYNGTGLKYVDTRPIYLDRYRTLFDWEDSGLSYTNTKIPFIYCGDTTTWLSTVSVVNDTAVLCNGTGSTKGIAVHSDVTSSSKCSVHAYINSGLMSDSTGIRFWCDGNGSSVNAFVKFYGTNMQMSFVVPANGGWVYVNWNDTFYNTSTYKNVAGTTDLMRNTGSLFFSFTLAAGATVYMDDIQVDLSNNPVVVETTTADTTSTAYEIEKCNYIGSGTVTTSNTLNDVGCTGKTFVVLDGSDNTALAGDYLEFTLPGVGTGSYSITAYNRDATTRSIFQMSVNGTNVGDSINFNASSAYGWHNCGTITVNEAGNVVVRFTITTAGSTGMYLDKIVLTKVDTPTTDATTQSTMQSTIEPTTEITTQPTTAPTTAAITSTTTAPTTEPTTVTTTEPTTVISILYGDINNDNNISSKDVLSLRQYLAEWDVQINSAAADVNADNNISSKDILLLRQYLAEWDVTLGK